MPDKNYKVYSVAIWVSYSISFYDAGNSSNELYQ